MKEPGTSSGGLSWALPDGKRLLYEYTHHRTVTSHGLVKSQGSGNRRADLVIEVEEPGAKARVTLTNIDDTGDCEDTHIEVPRNLSVYPAVVFDQAGRILENLTAPTYPLVFSPELTGLTQGGERRFDFEAPFKSGFSRCSAFGTVTTSWESTQFYGGSLCAVLVTTFHLQAVPGGYLWSPAPPWFRGKTVAHFDIEAGRLALLASSSQLEQTIGVMRLHQSFEITTRFVSG